MFESGFIMQKTITKEDVDRWVEWVHKSEGLSHCPTCLSLHECYFKESNMPMLPHHPNCHCYAVELDELIVALIVQADGDIRKFTEYVLAPNPDTKEKESKKNLFTSWGYDILDSNYLLEEFCRQAKEKYLNGEYELGTLNEHGQRISIRIELPRKDRSETVTFISGWMVEPNGTIRLTTPYGNK